MPPPARHRALPDPPCCAKRPAQTVVDAHGADTTRIFALFKAPPDVVLDWDAQAIKGPARWLQRVWAYAGRHPGPTAPFVLGALTNAVHERGGVGGTAL